MPVQTIPGISARPIFLLWIGLMLLFPATGLTADEAPRAQTDFPSLGSPTVKYPAWFKQSFYDLNEDIADALRTGKTGIMIYTSTSTCSYCVAFIEQSLQNPAIEKRVRKLFDVIAIEVIADTEITDVDGKTYHVKDFVRKYKAALTPSLIFFGKDGKLLLNITGYYPPDKFVQVLDYLEGGHYRNETWRDYFARRGAERAGVKSAIVRDADLFQVASENLDRRSGSSRRPLLVLFEQANCAPCIEMHKETLSVKSTRDWIRQYDAVQIDAADGMRTMVTPRGRKVTARAWAEQLDLAWFPAFVFFDERGREVFRIDTYTRNIRLEGTLELVLKKGYLDEPQLQRWRRQQFLKQNVK